MKLHTSLLFTLLITFSAQAEEQKIHTLKSVMQGLEASMYFLNQGIFNEDFDLIRKSALEIADHPKPKSQLPTIIKILESRMPEFKGFDGKVHDSAKEIAGLTERKDIQAITEKHSVIMKNCVTCHVQFRDEISKVLSEPHQD